MSFSRDFKGVWFPKEIWLNKGLSLVEKAILIEVDSLDMGGEHCFASNEYLAEFVGCSSDSVTRAIKKLVSEGFLTVEYKPSKEGKQRIISSCLAVRKMRRTPPQNAENPKPQNAVHSITLPLRDSTNTKNTLPDDYPPVILATLLLTEHRKSDPNFISPDKEKPTIQRWAKDIEKLIRLDTRLPGDIRAVIEWCQAPGCFWAPNILSGKKLRDKFPTLLLQSQIGKTKNKPTPTNVDPLANDPEWAEFRSRLNVR